ncbi:hypothetical protein CK623_13610 [Vandammella animalimorsus]|uniref:DUF11 domain-containing protein n=1 Tax=Vandammella animalimorsus TaxID=2029117 RepID=A0A2A2AIF8_9BURK|nr:DUF11 domain-containing protein [Vandammella animalimorsus]PAT37534.1 hypothetical protein CK623_13610 [Vandammella animalimorsus]
MKKRSKHALRAVGIAAAWAAMAGAAHADTVLLGINLDPGSINGLTLEPHQIKVVIKNEPSLPGTATNAPVELKLPPNLGGLKLVSSGAANCTTAPITVPSSTGAGHTVSWTIASLAPNASCEYVFEAVPLVVGSYGFSAKVSTGPADSQQAGSADPVEVENNRTVGIKPVALKVEKTIVQINGQPAQPSTDPDLNGIKAFQAGYGQPVRYQLRFTNASDVPLNLGELNDYWADYEYPITHAFPRWRRSQRPLSSTTDNASCAVEHNTPQPPGTATQSVCPEAVENDPNIANIVLNGGQGTDLRPIEVPRPMSGVMLAAGETMVLEYDRTYQPSDCGESLLRNGIEWEVNKYSNSAQSMQVQWQGNGNGTDEVFLALPMGGSGACEAVELNLQATKKLVEINGQAVTGTGTQALPDPGPGADAKSTAVFEIRVTNGHTPSLENYLAQPNSPDNILFTLYDLYRTVDFGAAPSFHPNDSLQEQIKVVRCESTIPGKACDLINPPVQHGFDPSNPNHGKDWGPIVSGSGSAMWDQIALELNETVTLHLAVQYRHNPGTDAPLCRKSVNTMVNALNVEVVKRPEDSGIVFDGRTEFDGSRPGSLTGTHQTPLELLADLPLCVAMSTNKSVTVTNHHDVQFTLDFTNATSANTGLISPVGSAVNPLKQVVFSDPLPASFKADDVSCQVIKGNAVLPNPPVSAANIDANNVFKATIPEIEDEAQIRCTIKGKDQTAGQHKNEARADVDPHNGAGAAGPTYRDPFGRNVGSATYLISGPQLKLDKTVQGPLQPGGEITWTIVASNISASATNGTINDTVPAMFESFTWTCASTGTAGGSCATPNGAGAGGETISVGAVIPAATSSTAVGEITLTIKGKLPAGQLPTQVNNSATLELPPGAGCIDPATNQAATPPCKADASISATLVALSKTALPASTTSYTPGSEVKFAVEVRNLSTTSQATVRLQDALPAGTTVMSWECMDQASNACGNGAGALDLPALVLAPDARQTYTVTVQVPAGFTGNLENIARLTPPADGFCQVAGGIQPAGQACEAPVSLTPGALPPPPASVLRITKTTSSTQLTPGGTAQFTVQVQNTSTTAVNAVQFNDALPAGIASQTWTCAAAPAGSCSSAAGNGAIDLTLDLPAGATATIAITATAEAANLPAQVVNTARITPPAGATCDPATTCEASAQVPTSTGPGPIPSNGVVAVSKTASSTSVAAGGKITFDIVVSASGGRDSHSVRIQDPLAAGIASQTWRCTAATGGASCPTPDQGSGALNAVLTQLPSGGQVRFQIEATTDAALPVGSQVINVATLSDLPSNVDCDPATGCSARNAAVPVIAAPSPTGTVPVPVGAPWMLALLALCMAGLARRQRR